MTIQHLITLFKEYDEYLERGYNCEPAQLPALNCLSPVVDPVLMRRHLRWLCQTAIALMTAPDLLDMNDIVEAALWLGYVQGELRAMQEFSVSQVRRSWRQETKR